MSNLYGKDLARVYDNMYQNFIDYNEEYDFYSRICRNYKSKSILDLGCGTGNLAEKFSVNFESYTGLDLSDDMLSIAREKYSKGNFFKGDMRSFVSPKTVDAVIIAGRSTSYLTSNADLDNTFTSVCNALNTNGIFVFDCIDADRFIPYIAQNRFVKHTSIVDTITHLRESEWFVEEKSGADLIKWNAIYSKLENNEKIILGNDSSIFRVFRENEITRLLELNGFEVLSISDRKSYAFDTFVMVARKK